MLLTILKSMSRRSNLTKSYYLKQFNKILKKLLSALIRDKLII